MAKGRGRELSLTTRPAGTWVQTDRAAHERWAVLALEHPRAAALMHLMVARMGRNNALVVSQQTLAQLANCSLRTVQYSLQTLREHRWIDVVQIGLAGTVNAYVVNDRVAWSGARDGMRYSLFSAAVLASANEQPEPVSTDERSLPLEHVPALHQGERQLPVSSVEPNLPGLDDPDLPARRR